MRYTLLFHSTGKLRAIKPRNSRQKQPHMEPSLTTERLPLSQLLSYGAPGFAIAALGLPLYVYLPSFYASEVGVSLATVGAILWLARIFDVITDPLIGTLSDRLSLPGGRRKPWAAVGAPLLLVGCWFLFIPREGAGAGF